MAFSSPAGGYCSSVQQVFTERLLRARRVLGAVLPHAGPWPPLEDAEVLSSVQVFSSHNLSVLGKGLPPLVKHHYFFFNQKGAVERETCHLTPHRL